MPRFQATPSVLAPSRISVIQYALMRSSRSMMVSGRGSILGGTVDILLKLSPWLVTRSRIPRDVFILVSMGELLSGRCRGTASKALLTFYKEPPDSRTDGSYHHHSRCYSG